jgi:hypothetical protein
MEVGIGSAPPRLSNRPPRLPRSPRSDVRHVGLEAGGVGVGAGIATGVLVGGAGVGVGVLTGLGADAADTATVSNGVGGRGVAAEPLDAQVRVDVSPSMGTSTVASWFSPTSVTVWPAAAVTVAWTVNADSAKVSFVPAASLSGPGTANSTSFAAGNVTCAGVDEPLNVAVPD